MSRYFVWRACGARFSSHFLARRRAIFVRLRRARVPPFVFGALAARHFPIYFVFARLRRAISPSFVLRVSGCGASFPPYFCVRLWRAIFTRLRRASFPLLCFFAPPARNFPPNCFGASAACHVYAPQARNFFPIFLARLRRAIFARLRRAIVQFFVFGAPAARHLWAPAARNFRPHFILRACSAHFPPHFSAHLRRVIPPDILGARAARHFCAPAAREILPIPFARLRRAISPPSSLVANRRQAEDVLSACTCWAARWTRCFFSPSPSRCFILRSAFASRHARNGDARQRSITKKTK